MGDHHDAYPPGARVTVTGAPKNLTAMGRWPLAGRRGTIVESPTHFVNVVLDGDSEAMSFPPRVVRVLGIVELLGELDGP